jgi:hypothetical protein
MLGKQVREPEDWIDSKQGLVVEEKVKKAAPKTRKKKDSGESSENLVADGDSSG